MYSNYNDLYTPLYHSGIKGMKLGVRRKAYNNIGKNVM